MTFTVGETVVYPNHGAAIIEDIEAKAKADTVGCKFGGN